MIDKTFQSEFFPSQVFLKHIFLQQKMLVKKSYLRFNNCMKTMNKYEVNIRQIIKKIKNKK